MANSSIGQNVRTLEGHAAMSMKRTGPDDFRWIEIQTTTFRNWVNEQLPDESEISDLETEFADGIKLIALVEALQSKPIGRKICKKPLNQHQYLENLSIALDAILKDKVKLVNIGSEDIVEGNLKLILGLIWHLILRYQIGKTKFPPKKMMLIWLQYALPKCSIKNFSSSWNDGVALHALIEFCRPGTCPNWEKLDPNKKLENCTNAMNIAKDKFDIPLVVRPEDLASPHLDELSGMTYLSYYMKQDSPGYYATLDRVKKLLHRNDINNFTTDWNDGQLVCEMVNTTGGNITNTNGTYEEVLTKGLNAGKLMSIQPTISAKEIAQEKEEHLGIMAYAVKYIDKVPTVPESEKVTLTAQLDKVHVGNETKCKLAILDQSVNLNDVKVEVNGPNSQLPVQMDWSGQTAEVKFTPEEIGKHKLIAYNSGNVINGCPKVFNVISDRSKVSYHQIENCCTGIVTEIKVNAVSAGQGNLKVIAKSPTNQLSYPSITSNKGMHTANFIPTEVGDWKISVLYDEDHISGSPFNVNVFDPSQVEIYGLEGGAVGKEFSFKADYSRAGKGDFDCSITHDDHQVPIHSASIGNAKQEVKFVPQGAGLYKIRGTFSNVEIKGSPYTLEIVDTDMVSVSGAGLELVPINKTASFNILTKGAGGGEVKVNISSPSGRNIPSQLTGSPELGFQVEYTPTEVGVHEISVTFGGNPIKNSPFQVKCYDASLVKVSEIPQGIVGVPCKFTVDTTSAGEGNLQADVFAGGKPVPYHMNYLTPNRYEVTILAQQATRHQVHLKFNSDRIPGSPYIIDYLDTADISASGEGLGMVCCQQSAVFTVDAKGASLSDLTIEITAPDGKELPVKLKNKGDHIYQAEWTPVVVGDHKIQVAYASSPIKNSPFTAKAYDAGRVTVNPATKGNLGKPVEFMLDTSKAGIGNIEILVSVNGETVPNYFKQETKDSCFRISFTPQEPSKHMVHVKFNGEPVPGSPFPVRILNSERIHVSGQALQLASANTLSSFKIDPKGAGEGDVTVNITGPSGRQVPARVSGSPTSVYRVDFTPTEIGKHTIKVCYDDVEIKGSPFYCNVFDANLSIVKGSSRAYLNRSITILVDTSPSGEGHLEAEVKCKGTLVRSNVQDLGAGKHEVTFTPREASTHMVTLLFNGYPLPGSPLHTDVLDSSSVSASGDGLKTAQVFRSTGFDVNTNGGQEDLDVTITSPTRTQLPFSKVQRGSVCHIDFTPREVGTYTIEALIAGTPISGSPFYCHVFDPNLVRITDVDRNGKVQREIYYTVDASGAGDGDLETAVTHYGRTLLTKRENLANNNYRFSFVPEDSGQYEVDVQFNNEQIPGCPVIVMVEDEMPTFITINFRGIRMINAMDLNWFLIELNGEKIDMSLLQILIRAPNGESIPAKLIPQHDGDYKVEWTPTVAGRYGIDILYSSKQIDGSPFSVDVFDINKIRVEDLYSTAVDEPAGFTVDFSEAGRAEHSITIVNPAGKTIPFELKENNAKNEISYIPTTPGGHNIFINYGGIEVPGTPIIQEVGEDVVVTARGEGLRKGVSGKEAIFYIDSSGKQGDIFVEVDGPNSVAKCKVTPQSDGTHKVTYIPVETGSYCVTVRWNGKDIKGSPFRPYIVDPSKVYVTGGWQHFMDPNDRIRLVVNEEKRIPFDVSEAGPGNLTAEVRDPRNTKLPVQIDTSGDGINTLVFTPKVEGDHNINIYWSDLPLVGSPFLGYAVPKQVTQVPDASKIVLAGKGLKEAVVREEAEFRIDGSKAGPGKPVVNLTGVRTDIDVDVIPQGNNCYRCKYMPIIPGAYLLNITWNDRQLKGSPYKITIIAAPQPQKVMITGEGLKGGMMGKDLQMNIDTRKAGLGELTAHCVGPNVVAYCELADNHDGIYKLTVRPQEAGRHVLQIKYGGDHILGSPYVLKIGSLPDASKVRVSGPGVEHGILATYQSKFLVETRGAGAGQLSVRIKGPKGAFQVEMYRDNQKDRNIICCYNPYETGLYIIQIKWSGVDVPGSPFQVHIVDTQQEYETIMQNTAAYQQNGYGFPESPSMRHSFTHWRE